MSYTLMIPSNQLFMLKHWDPVLKLQAFRGVGSAGSKSGTWSFEFGTAIEQVSRSVDLRYDMGNGEVTPEEVYKKVTEYVPDASLEYIYYVERNCKMGNPNLNAIGLKFKRQAIHPTIYKQLVINGETPLQDIAEILIGIKESTEDLPNEVKKRMRPSCLLLEETDPPGLKADGPCIYALKRSYMIFMRETSKTWKLFDLDYNKRGGPR